MSTISQIHNASMRILERTGCDLYSPAAVELVKSHGVKTDGMRVFFKEDQLMSWVSKAPESFGLHARNPEHDIVIGGKHTNFLSSTAGFPFISGYDGKERAATHDDFITFLKLNQQCPFFHINGGVMVTPSSIPADRLFPTMLLSMLKYTDKCMFGGMGGDEESRQTMGMLKIIFGQRDISDKARIITIISSGSPLSYHENMLITMEHYVKNGQAVIIAPGVMAGSTGPATRAGVVALTNAEALVGVAVAQMMHEGARVVYGSVSAAVDMRDASYCIGAPESAVFAKYCAELARFYHLPSRAGGTLTDSRSHTMQTGYEAMMAMLNAVSQGINLVLHSAGCLGSYRSLSFEKYIADLQILGMVRKYMEDIIVSDETLALDVIHEIGPGGEYITSEHTLEHFRGNFIPDAAIRGTVMSSDAESDHEYERQLTACKERMLAEYKKPDFDRSILDDLSGYLQKEWGLSCPVA